MRGFISANSVTNNITAKLGKSMNFLTSKQMFSPSLSQSSQRTRWSAPLASEERKAGILSLGVASLVSVGQRNSSAGSTRSQLLYLGRNVNFSKKVGNQKKV